MREQTSPAHINGVVVGHCTPTEFLAIAKDVKFNNALALVAALHGADVPTIAGVRYAGPMNMENYLIMLFEDKLCTVRSGINSLRCQSLRRKLKARWRRK